MAINREVVSVTWYLPKDRSGVKIQNAKQNVKDTILVDITKQEERFSHTNPSKRNLMGLSIRTNVVLVSHRDALVKHLSRYEGSYMIYA
jgi:hypothetical protein